MAGPQTILAPDFRRACTWFALPALLAVAATYVALASYQRYGRLDPQIVHWLRAAWLAAVAASLFAQSRKWNIGTATVLSLALVFVAGGIEAFHEEVGLFEKTFVAGLIVLCAAAPLAGLWNTDSFWIWNEKIWSAALLALVAGIVGWIAAGAAIFAAKQLFGPFEEGVGRWLVANARDDLLPVIFLTIAPIYFLALVPRVETADMAGGANDFLRRAVDALATWVLSPFVLVYAALLWVYAGKIALAGALPDGEVGNMVRAFGFVGFATMLAIYPQRDAGPWHVRLLWRAWPFLIIAPLVLLALALFVRIDDYGLTPDRYVAALLGVLGAASGIAALVWRARIVTLAPIVAAIALLAASIGPWGAVETSVRWQTATIRGILTVHGQIKDGLPDAQAARAPLSSKEWRRWQAAIDFLKSKERLRAAVGGSVTPYDDVAEALLRARVQAPVPEQVHNLAGVVTRNWLAPPGAFENVTILGFFTFKAPDTVWPATGEIRMAQTPSGIVLSWKGGPPTAFATHDLQAMLQVGGNNDETPLVLRPTTGDAGLILLLHDFQIDIGDPGDPKFVALTAHLLHAGRKD
jgi:hypothetical protein